MKKAYHLIETIAIKRNILIGLFLIILFNTFLLPILPSILWGSKISLSNILDLKFSYHTDECYTLFAALGKLGRKSYLLSALFIDNLYAIVYSTTYASIVFILLKTNKLLNYKMLIFIPFIIGIFDYFENFGIITMLYYYPLKMEKLVVFSSLSTSIKWIFAFATFIIILGNLILFLLHKIKTNFTTKI